MKNIKIENPKQVLLDSIADAVGLVAYSKTIKDLEHCNEKDYQKNYTAYYRVRRDKKWLKKYYNFMYKNRNNNKLTFKEIVTYISSVPHKTKTGMKCTLEVSFASKMLATINPKYPIWDGNVVSYLNLDVEKTNNKTETIERIASAYDDLKRSIEDFIKTPEGMQCILEFDNLFPAYTGIEPIKKIDFYLWKLGK